MASITFKTVSEMASPTAKTILMKPVMAFEDDRMNQAGRPMAFEDDGMNQAGGQVASYDDGMNQAGR